MFQDAGSTHEEVVEDMKVKKKESTRSNSKDKPSKETGQPFKQVNQDDRFVEEDR